MKKKVKAQMAMLMMRCSSPFLGYQLSMLEHMLSYLLVTVIQQGGKLEEICYAAIG